MARPRGQDGYVESLSGGRWKAHWYVYESIEGGDYRRHRSKTLNKMTKSEATKILRDIIARECGAIGAPTINGNSQVTFSWFWVNKFVPLCKWSKHTKASMSSLFRNHIEPRFGATPIADIDGPSIATWLNELAAKYSESLVKDARTYMNAAFVEAVEDDWLRKNPMRRVSLPELREPERPVATFEQLKALRQALKDTASLRDVVMFDCLCLTGMRPCEMLAMKWEHFRETEMFISQSFVDGEMKNTKTRGSKAWVAIPKKLSREIAAWKKQCNSERWMFPNAQGKPMRLDSWRRRFFRPAANAAGVEIDIRALRRSWATWAHDTGANLKAVQAQLRHASVATTGNVYVQAVDKAVRSAVDGVAKKYF